MARSSLRSFVRGGNWRNFKVKYPESNEMYSRMMMVSRRLEETSQGGGDRKLIDSARRELYRGQCNCGYWHGAFGGIYLPHLRNAVYNHLIAADNLLDQVEQKPSAWVDTTVDDFDLDARQEIQLANESLISLIAPARGGQLYELDVRPICHNLLATIARRQEAYHKKVLAGARGDDGQVASIHDRVVLKQEGLDQRLQYDSRPRKSLLDHFYDGQATLESVAQGEALEQGDFADGCYDAKLRRNPDRIQVVLSRRGTVQGLPIQLTKGVTLDSGSSTLVIAYLLESLPSDRSLHFGVEFNFAGLPAAAEGRFFLGPDGQKLGDLGSKLNLVGAYQLGLADQWLGVDLQLECDRPTNFWTYPIATVSQSESGIEMVHQSVVVLPHWQVQGDARGRWSITMRLAVDTSLASSRMDAPPVIAVTDAPLPVSIE